MFLSKYGVARHIYIPVVKRAVVDFAVSADWTPGAGDVKISKDGGAAANVTNLPVAITMGNTAIWDFSITATEMQAAQVVITVADSATKAVEDQTIIIETYGNASGQHAFDLATATQKVDLDTIKTNPVVNAGTVTFPTTATLASTTNITAGTVTTATNVTTVNGLAAGVITATAIAADAITDAKVAADVTIASVTGSVGSVVGAVGSVTGLTASDVGAIKTKTDQFVFTVANQVDANALTIGTTMRPGIRKNVALANFEFLMTDSTNHNPATGKTVTVTRSIDGGAFAAGTLGAVSELSNGIYYFSFGAGDLNGDVVTLRATATACDDLFVTIRTDP